MNIDHKLSHRIFRATKDSWLLRPLAIFCATSLLFVLATAVAMTVAGTDGMSTMMDRFLASTVSLGIPLLLVWGATALAQRLVNRERPFDDGQGKALITMVWTGPSFPSAHASLAFALALIGTFYAAELYGPWLWIGAGLVAWGRVAVGVHYVSDVIVGAVLGVVVGWASTIGLILTLVSLNVID
ncbi:phosphatase PAP2 family protein [Candidatus Uhrbacteria bacterium]|nr:phosphatase PAP2 family protein [Candidatus Uhrbacteria bacterium]